MARNTDYESELADAFSRWESSGFRNIRDWLTKDKQGRTVRAYGSGLKKFGNKLQKPLEVRENIGNAQNYGDVEVIQTQIAEFDFPERETIKQFNTLKGNADKSREVEEKIAEVESIDNLRRLQGEVGSLTFRRTEIGTAIDNAIDEYNREIEPAQIAFKSATTLEEREAAQEILEKESPRILGGIRSGEKRRAGAAFRSLF